MLSFLSSWVLFRAVAAWPLPAAPTASVLYSHRAPPLPTTPSVNEMDLRRGNVWNKSRSTIKKNNLHGYGVILVWWAVGMGQRGLKNEIKLPLRMSHRPCAVWRCWEVRRSSWSKTPRSCCYLVHHLNKYNDCNTSFELFKNVFWLKKTKAVCEKYCKFQTSEKYCKFQTI